MAKKFSIEVSPSEKPGHGPIRRSPHSPKQLITSPDDSIKTTYDILQFAARHYPNKDAVGSRKVLKVHTEEKKIKKVVDGKETEVPKKWNFFELSPYSFITFQELRDKAERLGCGLKALGMEEGDKVQIYAATSQMWLTMSQASSSQSFPIVTAYDTLGEEGLTHSLVETSAKTIFCDGSLLPTLVKPLEKATEVRHIVYHGEVKEKDIEELKKAYGDRLTIRDDEALEQLGRENPVAPNPPKAEDLCCVMYTSGSTGAPKGVVLTHANLVAAVGGITQILTHNFNKDDSYIAFLPLAHVLEFIVEHYMLFLGATMGYANVKTLTDASVRHCAGDIREFRPTIMVGVPAVFESVRKGILTKVAAGGFVTQKLFSGALSAKSFLNSWSLPGSGVLDAAVFKKVRQATGGRLRYTLSGGAPLSAETQRFLSTALCPMLIGYGLTETCAMCTIMPPEAFSIGPVGCPVPCSEIKLVSVEDAGYKAEEDKGEVWIRGPSITKGYFNRDKETAEAFTEDGWFMTGDIGTWLPNGQLQIIDRKKNLVKTAHGEYIALEKLESIYRTTQVVQNICVYADQSKVKPIAIIVPVEAALKKIAEEKGIKGEDLEDLCKDDYLKKAVLDQLLDTGKKAGLKGIELLQAAVLAPEEWTPQNGLVTSAQKLQRKKILEQYKDEVDHAYKHTSP